MLKDNDPNSRCWRHTKDMASNDDWIPFDTLTITHELKDK